MNLRKSQLPSNEFPSWLHEYTDKSKEIWDRPAIPNVFVINKPDKIVSWVGFITDNNKLYLYYAMPQEFPAVMSLEKIKRAQQKYDIHITQDNMVEEIHKYLMTNYDEDDEHVMFISDRNHFETYTYLYNRYGK